MMRLGKVEVTCPLRISVALPEKLICNKLRYARTMKREDMFTTVVDTPLDCRFLVFVNETLGPCTHATELINHVVQNLERHRWLLNAYSTDNILDRIHQFR